jgi:hypothetical protein
MRGHYFSLSAGVDPGGLGCGGGPPCYPESVESGSKAYIRILNS